MSPVVREFQGVLGELQSEVVHIHSLHGLPTELVDVAADFGAQVVMTLHDFFALCTRTHLHLPDGGPCKGPNGGFACGRCHAKRLAVVAGLAFAMRHQVWQRTLARCDHLVAPSAYVRDRFVATGVDEDRLVVNGPGVAPPARRALPGGDAQTIRFVYAGDLREEKGADLAITAMEQFDEGAVVLDIFGGPPAPPAPRQVAFEAQLKKLAEGLEVRFHGRYEPEDLDEALDGAAALLLPSRVRESFGRTANRALQAGVPVVAADHGAPPEFVSEGVNGALFEPGDSDDLVQAMTRVIARGLDMQAATDAWPPVPSLDDHADFLLGLYRGEA